MKNLETKDRCVNIDWLEVYVLEDAQRYPCNADYFRSKGYLVHEREYGTRTYKEMFVIEDENGNPMVEIRRNPASGDSGFSGLVPKSCHIRLPNWMCYRSDCVSFLRNFLLTHGYIFKRIYRIDICYDFEFFDYGDQPARFARRYLEGKYRKVNQVHLAAYGDDAWNQCKWESLSWGSRTSMVSTKMYNKTLELSSAKNDKPYIRSCWFQKGLVDNPIHCTKRDEKGNVYKPEIWRVEFSLKSAADNWLVIEDISGKKVKKKAIPHRLSLFDSQEKLWSKFQDLAFHYFHFKYKEFRNEEKGLVYRSLNEISAIQEKELKRKDRCQDKKLFKWDANHVFTQVSSPPPPSKQDPDMKVLLRRLIRYRETHFDPNIRKACDILIESLEKREARRLLNAPSGEQFQILQRVIALKMGGDQREVAEITAEVQELINNNMLF